MLALSERLAEASPEAVPEFLRNVPIVMGRVRDRSLEMWFQEGLRVLHENEDGGLAYFRLESARAEETLEALAHGLALERVQDVLRLYCCALAGETVKLKETQELKDKGIGWKLGGAGHDGGQRRPSYRRMLSATRPRTGTSLG